MYEELFVIVNGERRFVDLSTPSGITLNFKSNLFGDVSKISCSNTYTFKLPLTANNRRIFDNADDIRHPSGMIRKRLKAEFCQNGINLFSNANLYISSISKDSYSAIMTWDVVSGFQEMQDNDISLKELTNFNYQALFGGGSASPDVFSNNELVLYPLYDCGLPYFNPDVSYTPGTRGRQTAPSHYAGYGAYPMPVVPVFRIIDMINGYYGTHFKLGKLIGGSQLNEAVDDEFDVINRGVIPLVGIDLNDTQLEFYSCNLLNPKLNNPGVTSCELDIPGLITFGSITIGNGSSNPFFISGGATLMEKSGANGPYYSNTGISPQFDMMSFDIDGYISLTFTDITTSTTTGNMDEPTLSVYQLQTEFISDGRSGAQTTSYRRKNYRWVELASVEGEIDGSVGNLKKYVFDFAADNGQARLECENVQSNQPIIFVLNYRISAIVDSTNFFVYLRNSDKCKHSRPIDIISNLPGISCLTFMKTLFYMIGSFPIVDNDGNIVPRFYSDIETNLINNNVLDWSSKDQSQSHILPEETLLSVNDFSQKNHYIMQSDNLDKTDKEKAEETDVYESGVGTIYVENEILSMSKTIFQSPFYAPYIKNKKKPSIATGNTMKVWTLGDSQPAWYAPSSYHKAEWNAPNPCYGLVYVKTPTTTNLQTGEVTTQAPVTVMTVWNRFKEIDKNPSYKYMQKIINNPYIIKVNLKLNEFDLRDLDYTVPVYLEKYNSYFAIVSIQRDSQGICKCELIKLPSL